MIHAGTISIGGSAGAAASLTPAPEVRTYIDANPHDAVVLDGEVVVGAGIPDSVTLYEIPDQKDFKYVIVNGQPVLVNPADRRIVCSANTNRAPTRMAAIRRNGISRSK